MVATPAVMVENCSHGSMTAVLYHSLENLGCGREHRTWAVFSTCSPMDSKDD